ncbi:SpoIIE family protein phosphatase [Streptomyces sp. IB2014 016-6]|uniref:SpoIIE family protein phosphatase n=1 Tax=Streptomyces sp. IB2014 016-6 TaxID=2517818 RepID=UPI0011C75FC4|nr:SpoIIE family protein phosphatase [Streptomyces sp. IB2014 016-6]TXL88292.1 PAS domain-containing protein [Streptomyces sp. IB2014 016-6]
MSKARAGAGGVPPEGAARAAGMPDMVGAAVCVVDEDGTIAWANAHAERVLGRDAAALVGRDAHDLLHRDQHGQPLVRASCRMTEAFLARVARVGSGWFERGDGSLVELAWLVAPCAPDGAHADTMVIFTGPDRGPDGAGLPAGSGSALSELERLALLAETTTQLTSTLDSEEALRRLVRLVVPRVADWAVVDLITEPDEVERAIVVHYEDGAFVTREELQGPMPPVPEDSPMPLSRALRGAASTLVTPETYQGPPDTGVAIEQRRLFEATGMVSAAIAPIRGVRDVLGALTLGRSKGREPLTGADLSLLDDLTRRTGVALDNARLYQRQRKVAETMQRHLLAQLPSVPGLELAARYVPAPDDSQVGGDWYDAFTVADVTTALVIGDVVGHDLDAAAGMAQVRSMLRAYAWTHHEPPSAIVHRLDASMTHLTGVPTATLVFGKVEQGADGTWCLTWTNAGHPPPLLITHDGRARYLTQGHGLLLGTGLAPVRDDAVLTLPPRSTLVLYTDGLVESRDRPIDEGLDQLRKHAASLAHRPLAAFTDLLLERARPPGRRNDDDVAILTLRTPAAQT